jgi:hypothetical protein
VSAPHELRYLLMVFAPAFLPAARALTTAAVDPALLLPNDGLTGSHVFPANSDDVVPKSASGRFPLQVATAD